MPKIDFREGVLSGSIEGITGVVHKEKNFVRKRVIPYDPQTIIQQDFRGNIKKLNEYGKRIYIPLLKPYTLPRPKKATIYNHYVSINKSKLLDVSFEFWNMKAFAGDLFFPVSWNFVVQPAVNQMSWMWNTGLQGEASSADYAICWAMDTDTHTLVTCLGAIRSDVFTGCFPTNIKKPNNVWGFLAFGNANSVSIQAGILRFWGP